MLTNEFNNEAVNAAPETGTTANPGSVEQSAPESQENDDKVQKTFSQEELDAIIGKRLAKEQRKWEREQHSRTIASQPKPQVSNEALVPEQFSTYEEYAEALADRKAEALIRQRDAEKQRAMVETAYEDRAEEARTKYDDFDDVVQNPRLRITNEMAESIMSSEIGPDLAYHLGSNPKEAERIANLSPLAQAREIGKLEAKLSSEPLTKKTTSAPAPISPVKSKGGNPSYDTTDPRSTKTMTDDEWINAERQRQIRKLKGS